MTDVTHAVVTCNATFTLPPGSALSTTEPNTVVCPNGDKLKFWVVAELVATDEDDEVNQMLDGIVMHQLGISVEHDETLITLAETPDAQG